MALTFPGRIVKGHLQMDRSALMAQLERMPDGDVVVTIKPDKDERSVRQLRYHFGRVLKAISEETGQDVESLHDFYCDKLLGALDLTLTNPKTGEVDVRHVYRRTTGMNVSEMFAFTEQIRQHAADWLGIYIPPPNEAS